MRPLSNLSSSTSSTRTTQRLGAIAALALVISALACAAPQPQQGDTSATQQQAQTQPAQQAQPAQAADMPKPTAESVALAKQSGIAAADPASGVAGPYPGPEGSIYYLNAQGLATFYLPNANAAYLAKLTPQLSWHYGFSAAGYYQFTPQGAVPLQNLAAMSPWPHAVAVANAVAARAKQQQAAAAAQPAAQPAPQQQQMDWATYQRLSQQSAAQHRSMMRMIDGLGDSGCTKRYEGVYYVGCW